MTRRRVSNPLALAVPGLPHREAHAPLRDLHDAAHPRQGEEHQAQLRLALRRRRVAAEARADRRPRDHPRGPAAGAHRLRDHRGRREEFEDWLAELLSTPVRDYTSLEAGLSLMPGPAAGRGRAAARRRARQAPRRAARPRRRARRVAGDGPAGALRHREQYRRQMLQAELEFVDRARRAHPQLRASPAPRPGGGSTSSRAGGTPSRRSWPTPSATSGRRPGPATAVDSEESSEKAPGRCGNTGQGHVTRAGAQDGPIRGAAPR